MKRCDRAPAFAIIPALEWRYSGLTCCMYCLRCAERCPKHTLTLEK